jgi:hypothetical protein
MTELSPQTQAVLDAATSVCHPETEIVAFQCTRLEVAAALRAVADQVVPKDKYPSSDWTDKDEVRYQLLAIAAELEGGNV